METYSKIKKINSCVIERQDFKNFINFLINKKDEGSEKPLLLYSSCGKKNNYEYINTDKIDLFFDFIFSVKNNIDNIRIQYVGKKFSVHLNINRDTDENSIVNISSSSKPELLEIEEKIKEYFETRKTLNSWVRIFFGLLYTALFLIIYIYTVSNNFITESPVLSTISIGILILLSLITWLPIYEKSKRWYPNFILKESKDIKEGSGRIFKNDIVKIIIFTISVILIPILIG